SDRKDAWSERDREMLLTAASIVAAAIQNARAYEREAAAQRRVDELEERLADAEQLIALARTALRDGDRVELDRQLTSIQAFLLPASETRPDLELPSQRS